MFPGVSPKAASEWVILLSNQLESLEVYYGTVLKKRVEMPDKMILGNTEFVFDRKLGFHVGEWTVWDRKTKILLEFQSTEGNIGDIVLER